jgi:hypothetical protein
MVPALGAMLSLPALKPLDKERRGHIDDFNRVEAVGLFAGLDILPKKSFATSYSYRTQRIQQWERLLPLAGVPVQRLREVRPEATVPSVGGNRRGRDD